MPARCIRPLYPLLGGSTSIAIREVWMSAPALRCTQSYTSALFGLLSSCVLWSQACCPPLHNSVKTWQSRAFHPFCDGLHKSKGRGPNCRACTNACICSILRKPGRGIVKGERAHIHPNALAHKIARRWLDKVQSAARRPAPSGIPHAQPLRRGSPSSSFVSDDQRPVSTPMSNERGSNWPDPVLGIDPA